MSAVMRRGNRALLAGALLLIPCCSDKRSTGTGDILERLPAGQSVRIVFRLPGDDIGSTESREVLGRIGDAFRRSGTADTVRTGFGMGSMEIIIRARTELSADAIDRIILAEYPKAKYRTAGVHE